MRIGFAISALFLMTSTAYAQQFVGAAGACMLETANNDRINIGACLKKPAQCTPTACETAYYWQGDDFNTLITTGYADAPLREGTAMNGQPAYAAAALVSSDPRDCIYNETTDGLFCFIPGAEAHATAINTDNARNMLISLVSDGEVNVTSGKKGSKTPDTGSNSLAAFQGKYRPIPSWDCSEIGRDGGATAIQGDTLYMLDTECKLSGATPVGTFGAALFQANCTGEGETWSDEIILKRDEWGSLAVLRSDAVSVWQTCD